MFRIDELKKKLENGGLAIGTHVKWREASFSELFAMEGYDYIWIDGEHSALTLDMVAAQVQSADASIEKVAVTSDKEDVKKIEELASKIQSGTPASDLEQEIDSIARNVTTMS